MFLSDYSEQNTLDHILNKETFTSPATHISLFTATPSDSGGGTEATGGSYARVLVNEKTSGSTPRWNAAAAASPGYVVDNAQAVAFPQATADWGIVKAWGVHDAATTGNLLWWGPLGSGLKLFCGLNAGDLFHSPAHGFSDTNKVVLISSEGGLPAGVSEETEYFIVTATTDNFQLSLTSGGAAIVLTSDGAGMIFLSQWRDVKDNDTLTFAIGDFNLELR